MKISKYVKHNDNLKCYIKTVEWGFPGGTVVKNLPANTGNTGASPDPGRSHMPWTNLARVPQALSLCSRAREPQLLKPTCSRACVPQLLSLRAATTKARVPRARALQQEKPPQRRVALARRN